MVALCIMLIDQHIIEEDAKKDIQFERIMEFIRSDLYMKIAQADEFQLIVVL
jgi:ATP-dependent helicase/nuclease subunit A